MDASYSEEGHRGLLEGGGSWRAIAVRWVMEAHWREVGHGSPL